VIKTSVINTSRFASVVTLAVLFFAVGALAQTDPGVQSASRGTGAALSSVLANDNAGILTFFHGWSGALPGSRERFRWRQ